MICNIFIVFTRASYQGVVSSFLSIITVKVTLYEYQPSRSAQNVDEFWKGFSGRLHVDVMEVASAALCNAGGHLMGNSTIFM